MGRQFPHPFVWNIGIGPSAVALYNLFTVVATAISASCLLGRQRIADDSAAHSLKDARLCLQHAERRALVRTTDSVLSRQPMQVSFKTLISEAFLSYWMRMYTGLHPFSNTKINVKSLLSKTCWNINKINWRRIVSRNFLQSCSFVRDNKLTYFAGIGTPLASKSFRNTQPQLNSPLSPVDYQIKEAQRMMSEISTHKQ